MSRKSLDDLRDYLKANAEFPIPPAGFDRDQLMRRAGQAEMARYILATYLKDPQEDLEHVLR